MNQRAKNGSEVGERDKPWDANEDIISTRAFRVRESWEFSNLDSSRKFWSGVYREDAAEGQVGRNGMGSGGEGRVIYR